MSYFFLLLVSYVLADVAYVQFTSGSITGTIRFTQGDTTDVSIDANLVDSSNSFTSVSWKIYSNFVDSCSDEKGTQTYDLSSILGADVSLGASSYTTTAFSVSDVADMSIVLGDDLNCAAIVDQLEAKSVDISILWDEVVEEASVAEAQSEIANGLGIDTSLVTIGHYYPVRATGTLRNIPAQASEDQLKSILYDSLVLILGIQPQKGETLELEFTDNGEEDALNVTFIITSYDTDGHEFTYNSISQAESFESQVTDAVNFLGSRVVDFVWGSEFVVTSVSLWQTIALSTSNVDDTLLCEIDVDTIVANTITPGFDALDDSPSISEYTVVSESRSPSVKPTQAPSQTPSQAPSKSPSASPTKTPSHSPSMAPSCSDGNTDYLGDVRIQLDDSETTYANGVLDLTVHFPFKYTAQSIGFRGDTDDVYLYSDSDTEDPWAWSFVNCLTKYTVSMQWSKIQDGSVGITWNGADNTFDGVLLLHLKETVTKEGSQTLGNTFVRDVELEMPFSILMHTSIVVESDLSIQINGATLESRVLNGLTVVVPDGDNPSVTVTFATEVPYPWELDGTQFVLAGPDVVGGTETLSETSSENCDVLGQSCKQYWSLAWETNNVCDPNGDFTVTITAQYLQVPPYKDEVTVDIGFSLSLLPSCQVTVATVEPTASLVMYPDNTYGSSQVIFYIDDEAFGRITVDALQDIASVTMNSLTISQGSSKDLTSADFEYSEVARTTGDTATIDFSCRLALSQLVGELTGRSTTITADMTLTYVDGTRRLMQVASEYDVHSHADTTSTIVIMGTPCMSPVVGKVNDIHHESCSSGETKVLLCERSGWKTLADCEQTVPVIESEIAAEESATTTDLSPWMKATLGLVALIVIGGAAMWKFSSNENKDTFEFSNAQIAA